MPRASTRSLERTRSMSQRTMPSMSCGVRPASAMAASDAWVASVSSLRPESRLKSLHPIPLIAQRSRCWNVSSSLMAASSSGDVLERHVLVDPRLGGQAQNPFADAVALHFVGAAGDAVPGRAEHVLAPG